ncbi:hypothetical protein HPB49_002508 [Dermacentor silvarum]|uniref:Uncharacterized protein n=1 Tax=Dermacentor silvarum TaxID=543639 RepID=A0ACB8D9X9_DERSI|nr:hypothetical protein HPB49_002508 [Dermacentor silvarum]
MPTAYVIAMELFPASVLQHIARGLEEPESRGEVSPQVADTKVASGNVRLPPVFSLRDFFLSSSIRDSSDENGEEEGKSELSDASSFDDDGLKRPNDLYERYLFRIRTQRDGESHRKFLQALKDQADNCDFGECLRHHGTRPGDIRHQQRRSSRADAWPAKPHHGQS